MSNRPDFSAGSRLVLVALCAVLSAGSAAAFDWASVEPGKWYAVPSSLLADHAPDPEPPGNFGSIMGAWSGGAYDTSRDWMIIWGGGHGDYAGNEIMAFDVNTLEWRMVSGPSAAFGGDEGSGEYPDGTPRARHTYGYIQYVPPIDMFCTMGGSGMYPSGQIDTDKVHCNDFDNTNNGDRGWQRMGRMPQKNTSGARSAYDPVTGLIWVHGAGQRDFLYSWDSASDHWETRTGNEGGRNKARVMDVDPVRRKLVETGKGETTYYDIDGAGMLTLHDLNTTGDKTAENGSRPGWTYDPVSDRFIAWYGGANVYALDMDTAHWTRCSPAPGNSVTPASPQGNGTYGRFRYIPSKNAFILVNDVDEPVYIYKLSPSCGGSEEPPDDTPPTVPGNVSATAEGQTSVVVAWSAAQDPESGVFRYKIYRDGVEAGQSQSLSFTDSGLDEGTTYGYRVTAVNGWGLESAQSAQATATTAADQTPPSLVSATAEGLKTEVTLAFSEPVSESSAETASNYAITGGVSVQGATLQADPTTVVLTTSPHVEGTTYTLTVSGVQDRATTPNTIAAGSSVGFVSQASLDQEIRILDGADDVEEDSAGTFRDDSDDLELGEIGSGPQVVGLRFPGVSIPEGAIVTAAWVQFTAKETDSSVTSLTIEGEAADDAAALSGPLSNRSRTSAAVAWTPESWTSVNDSGAAQRTPGLTGIVQEIVGRPGWRAGNALALFVAGSGKRTAWSQDGASDGAPVLHLEWAIGDPDAPPSTPGGLQLR